MPMFRKIFPAEQIKERKTVFDIYVIWHDWANYHEATFTDRKKAADYIRRVRRLGPRSLTRLTVIHA